MLKNFLAALSTAETLSLCTDKNKNEKLTYILDYKTLKMKSSFPIHKNTRASLN